MAIKVHQWGVVMMVQIFIHHYIPNNPLATLNLKTKIDDFLKNSATMSASHFVQTGHMTDIDRSHDGHMTNYSKMSAPVESAGFTLFSNHAYYQTTTIN